MQIENPATKKKLISYLRQFVTERRYKRLKDVLEQRTRAVTVLLEDLYQPHNASAVLRSCDGFGVQDVHIIENRNQFAVSRGVTIGAEQWLTLHRYGDAEAQQAEHTDKCLQHIKRQGYDIVATTPHQADLPLSEIPVDRNLALLFGAEYEGLTPTALEGADFYARIPMVGFSESFNISVSAALALYDITGRLRNQRSDWPLTENEKTDLMLEWLQESIRGSDKLIEKFFDTER